MKSARRDALHVYSGTIAKRLGRSGCVAPALAAATGSLIFLAGAAGQSLDSRTPMSPASESASHDYADFQLIAQRNIFNGSRRASSQAPPKLDQPSRVETLTLVGSLSYDKGVYAFFDGSGPEFRKVLETGQSVGEFTVSEIHAWGVCLQAQTNRVELRVGMQMRREEDADWKLVAADTRASGAVASAALSASVQEESDIVKRLMQQREQELK